MSIDNKWSRALECKLTGELLIIEGYGGLKLVKSFGCLVRSVYLCTTETSRSRAVVAHRAHNPKVVGSSPASATKHREVHHMMGLSFFCAFFLCQWLCITKNIAIFAPCKHSVATYNRVDCAVHEYNANDKPIIIQTL